MPLAQINGNRLYFEDSGGSGPAIVFSHGALLDHTMWEHEVDALSGDYRCVTWDERGHGMSECNSSFDYWDSGRDAIALLDELGIQQAVFVGMSQGGWLTQRAAIGSPERVRGIVLMATSVGPLSAEELEGYGQLAQGWQALGPTGEIAAASLGVQFGGTDYDGSRYVGKWQAKPPRDWTNVWEGVLQGLDDITERIGEIACPALFIHGAVDQAWPVDFAWQMSEMVADSRGVTVIDGGPHAFPLTHPDEVNEALRGFMQTL